MASDEVVLQMLSRWQLEADNNLNLTLTTIDQLSVLIHVPHALLNDRTEGNR